MRSVYPCSPVSSHTTYRYYKTFVALSLPTVAGHIRASSLSRSVEVLRGSFAYQPWRAIFVPPLFRTSWSCHVHLQRPLHRPRRQPWIAQTGRASRSCSPGHTGVTRAPGDLMGTPYQPWRCVQVISNLSLGVLVCTQCYLVSWPTAKRTREQQRLIFSGSEPAERSGGGAGSGAPPRPSPPPRRGRWISPRSRLRPGRLAGRLGILRRRNPGI